MDNMTNKEGSILARGCRCSLLGFEKETDICHHQDKACHKLANENERCHPHLDWRERFDEKFPPVSKYSQRQGDYTESPIPAIKSFIAEVEKLAEARGRQQNRDAFTNKWIEEARKKLKAELVESGEKKRKVRQFPLAEKVSDRVYDCDVTAYNQAISDYQDIIKST